MTCRLPRSALAAALALLPAVVRAGPPYTTDDPEPVEYRHWEVYLASAEQRSRDDGWTGTAPHLEVNYGAVPDVQLHAIVPVAWARPPGGDTELGLGDIELGVKWRFVHEGDPMPQIGTFPLVELPTGDEARGLGSGHTQLFLPLWLQKSFGPWTTYGGGGWWLNPGPGNRNWWYVGWQAQRRLSPHATLGAEIFHGTSREEGRPGETRLGVGLVIDVSELHHVLLSAARSLDTDAGQAYVAYQLTFGPAE